MAAQAVVVGAGGAIGGAVAERLHRHPEVRRLYLFSSRRTPVHGDNVSVERVDYQPESIRLACQSLHEKVERESSLLRYVVVCCGRLHGPVMLPEKRLESVALESLVQSFTANAAIPLLWLQGLLPILQASPRVTVAFLSARVGSISDNTRGGWYGYRSSKAALNMLLKTASVELARRAPGASLIAFQPGTTASELSAPFLGGTPEDKVFEPAFVAERLVSIMDDTPAGEPLRFIDWAGKPIPW